ncbi:glycoside hydrolase family 3 N-terminal domain-containing protein [Microbacterium sp. NPDC055357]
MTRHRPLLAALLCLGALVAPSAPAVADTGAEKPLVVVRAATPEDDAARAAALRDSLSLRERAATVVMGHIPTTDAAAVSAYVASTGVGGFILMGSNIPATEAELQSLTAAMTVDPALPPLLAIDQEGGDVTRLPWDDFASAIVLKDRPVDEARDAFAGRAALVQRAGIAVNFGIVADVTSDPGMFIHRRALGTTSAAGAERVAAAVEGEHGTVLSTLKHFPGHGAAPGDSHAGIPSTDMPADLWRATAGEPFAAGIDTGAELLMFGHLAYTAVDAAPATLSPEWHRIAREDLGFDGVIVTDDLGMLQASGDPAYADPVANAVAALAAGNDMVLAVMFSTADSATLIIDGIVTAVESGALPASRLDDAAARVLELRLQLAADGRGLLPCTECAPAE